MSCDVPSLSQVQGPYIGADGRVKHMRLIGVDIPEQPVEGKLRKDQQNVYNTS